MKQFKILSLIALFCSVFVVQAQTKLQKVSKRLDVDKDVTINLNTSYTNIEIDTWNKGSMEIEAYVEGKTLSKEALEEIVKNWNVNVEGGGNNVTIETKGGYNYDYNSNFHFIDDEVNHALKELQIHLAEMPEIPEMPEMPEIPEINFEMPEMPEMPELPELPEGVHNVNFDVEKYKKEGESYLDKWGDEYEEKYGKAYKERMKDWAREFAKADWDAYSKRMEVWGENFGKAFGDKFGKEFEVKMEAWGKEYEKKFGPEWEAKMEEWGEKFGEKFAEKYEERAEHYEERAKALEKRKKEREKRLTKRFEEREEALEKRMKEREARSARLENRLESHKNNKVIKTIKIKIPKDAKLKMNVRHGELKFASVLFNLDADLKHTNLLAEAVDGSESSINASYGSVKVNNWLAGDLSLKYVEHTVLGQVTDLMLSSNSSNISIGDLKGNSVIDESFGDLIIQNISDSFSNLNLVLENSDANVKLPKAGHNLHFKGSYSSFNGEHIDRKILKNSGSNANVSKSIIINAKYSNVIMQ